MDYNQILKSGIRSSFRNIPVNFCDSPQPDTLCLTDHNMQFMPLTSFQFQPASSSDAASSMSYNVTIHVIMLPSCRTEPFAMRNTDLIYSLKEKIARMENAPLDKICLMQNGRMLEDSATLSAAGITAWNNFVCMKLLNPSGMINLDISFLDSQYDCDFTNMMPRFGERYERGECEYQCGYEYQRPYGWYRMGLRVLDKYGPDNDWIGPINTARVNEFSSARGEWPVTYHGTKRFNVEKIVLEGFRPGDRARFGVGVYTTPSIDLVREMYAEAFQHTDGQWYQMAFQNRVNPDKSCLAIINKTYTGVGADYWVSHFQNVDSNRFDVRPYGILIRQCRPP